ncbi:hypothetical protein FI667_g17003, partial [Globisporangium splendens]
MGPVHGRYKASRRRSCRARCLGSRCARHAGQVRAHLHVKAHSGNFSATVAINKLTPQRGEIFTSYPSWTANAKASSYKSLKEFILKNQESRKSCVSNPKTAECGFTDPNKGPVQALLNQLKWHDGQMNHPGPCEGKIPHNKAKCVGKNRLTLYWMSTLSGWQVYIDCAKIGNVRKLESQEAVREATQPTRAREEQLNPTT